MAGEGSPPVSATVSEIHISGLGLFARRPGLLQDRAVALTVISSALSSAAFAASPAFFASRAVNRCSAPQIALAAANSIGSGKIVSFGAASCFASVQNCLTTRLLFGFGVRFGGFGLQPRPVRFLAFAALG